MRSSNITILTAALVLILTFQARSQVIEDALRLSDPADIISARTAAMGNAFVGLADDVTALYWNPAGLAQLRYSEFAVGLTNFSVTTDATLLGSTGNDKQSVLKFNDIALAVPVPVVRGALVFGAAYNRLSDYTGGMNTSAYNHLSSIQRSLYNAENEDVDLAWQLGLEDTLVLTLQETGQPGWLAIPVADNVQQTIAVREEGGLGQWSFGGSSEIARGVMLGMSFNILTGYYRYDRTFFEEDVQNVHTGTIVGIGIRSRTDFRDVEINEIINQNLSGFNFTFGFLYNHENIIRGGITIRTPRYISVREDYTKGGTSFFRNANEQYEFTLNNTQYEISTPWVFSFGGAFNPVEFVVVSADVDITDFTEASFNYSNYFSVTRLNNDIYRNFRSTNNFRLGTEINIPRTGLYLRGGFGYQYSPYREDRNTSDYDKTTWSGGLGYLFENRIMLNATIVSSSYNTWTYNYTDPDLDVPEYAFRTDQVINSTRLMFSLSYRF